MITVKPPIVVALVANWADILEVIIPVEAAAGEQVIMSIPVKNITNYSFRIGVAVSAGAAFTYLTPVETAPGMTATFSASFIMPNNKVTVTIRSFMVITNEWGIDEWFQDDEVILEVNLPGVVPDGSITKKQLEWNGTYSDIPVENIPTGKTGLVHITGKNNSAIKQDMGIHWIIRAPDGTLVEDYPDWSYGHSPGSDHIFKGGRFNLDKPGPYSINVALSFNPSAPVIVDSYSGDLCSIGVEVKTLEIDITPEGTGTVTTDPASIEGKKEWKHDDIGTFPYGTIVTVTAIPKTGYYFDHWSDEILGGTSVNNPEQVQPMVQNRAVKCHFRVGEEKVETLEIDITPAEGGHVETSPASEEGKTEWHNGDTGTFPYGTKVQVTAHPATGYFFDHWSDEIVGGTSVANPSYVQDMTEHRAVKCHFRTEEEKLETLEVDITPVGKGYVTTVPASKEGKTTWHNDETGTFLYGTKVQVTAHPEEGYVFEKWSDEIIGGVSYQNPEYVQDMTEHRAVKAHFITEEEAEVPFVEGDAAIEEVIILHGTGLIAGTEKIPPVTGVKIDDWFKIMVTGRNNTERAMRMKLRFIITKPDGSTITDTIEQSWPYTGGKGTHRFVEPTYDAYDIDVVGNWNLSLELMAGDVVLDTWEGLILSGVEAGPPGIGETLAMIGPLLMIGLVLGLVTMISPMMKEGF